MAKPTTKIELELTKDEMMVLLYVVPYVGPHGCYDDPLKDIYELERDCKHEIEDPYEALGSLNKKVTKALKIDDVTCDCPQDDDDDTQD